jgi:hypothetical protein
LTDFRFPVERGHILLFARAIGDDPAAEEAIGESEMVAPLTFVQASAQFNPEYHLRPKVGQEWFGSGAGPGTAPPGGGGLHAEQSFEYHKPVLAGMVLTATERVGKEWEKASGRGGRLLFAEKIIEYRDQADDLVVVARSVGVKVESAPDPASEG